MVKPRNSANTVIVMGLAVYVMSLCMVSASFATARDDAHDLAVELALSAEEPFYDVSVSVPEGPDRMHRRPGSFDVAQMLPSDTVRGLAVLPAPQPVSVKSADPVIRTALLAAPEVMSGMDVMGAATHQPLGAPVDVFNFGTDPLELDPPSLTNSSDDIPFLPLETLSDTELSSEQSMGDMPVELLSPNVSPEYVVGPGDGFKVTVWGYPELSEQVIVVPSGMVSFPLVGSVDAAGLTTQELEEKIGLGLQSYIRSPRVSVVVTTIRSHRFSVIGEVGRAGVYPLIEASVSVLEAVAEAGGFGAMAIPAEAKIFRQGDQGTAHVEIVDLTALLEGELAGPVPTVGTGDVLYIPSRSHRRQVSVLGEVNAPGLYSLRKDMTVIEALTAAGWVRSSGVLQSVMVVRRNEDGQQEAFRIDAHSAIQDQDWSQHLPLQPGDIIYVPKKFISKVGDFLGFFGSRVEPAAGAYLRVYDATDPQTYVNFR